MDTPKGLPNPPASTPGTKMIDLESLPRSMGAMLGWLDPMEYRFVRTGLFHSPFARDMFESARFVDSVLQNSLRAEDRVGQDRITGTERDGYRDGMEKAVRELVRQTTALAMRARLTQILQANRAIVNRYAKDLLAGGSEAGTPAAQKTRSTAAA